MSFRSFPSRPRRLPLRAWPFQLASLLVLILAGCGGSGRSDRQTLGGAGFRFEAPATWTVQRKQTSVAASHGNVDLVEVLRYRLVKPYRPALFDATVRELDNDISKLAKQLSGRVAGRRTVRIAGRKSRSYVIEYGPGKSQEIAFVLEGETEYELLCRRRAAESDAVCAAFFAGFSLT